METILLVDDNRDIRLILSHILREDCKYNVIAVENGEQALKEIKTGSCDLVLLDIRLPDMSGMEVLSETKKINKDLSVIMVTAYGDVKDAVDAMRLGAFDYITKPFNNEELIFTIKKAIQARCLSKEVEMLKKKLSERIDSGVITGSSPQIKQTLKQVDIIASTNVTVIIQGESGTGKELIARMIYEKSMRKLKPFIAVDCGAIPKDLAESELFGYEKGAFTGANERREGKFEQANGGTLFLDEITNLSQAVQMKLLRVLQEKRLQRLGGKKELDLDVRVIVATNANITEAATTGQFRMDLYHRLNEFCISLPSLKERKEDIPILAGHFLNKANVEFKKEVKGFTSEVLNFFLKYSWPGNVREFKNVIKRAVLTSDSEYIKLNQIIVSSTSQERNQIDLNDYLEKGETLHDVKESVFRNIEKELVEKVLVRVNGNKSKAAKILGVDRVTLYAKIKQFQTS